VELFFMIASQTTHVLGKAFNFAMSWIGCHNIMQWHFKKSRHLEITILDLKTYKINGNEKLKQP
jgi:hypothetical protein